MIKGIAIVGGNGSGKTTLGKKLSKELNFKHMDVEDYYFLKSKIPYSKSRSKEEVTTMLLKDIKKYKKFILTSVTGNYGDKVSALIDLVIYLAVPLDIRLKRVKERSFKQFGSRMLPGGDMYEAEQDFFNYVSSRSLEETNNWIKNLPCPVIYIDGTKKIDEIVKNILENLKEIIS